MIGILGGMGPQAGIDLASKIVASTVASSDSDHIPTLLYSEPQIPDRTAFLNGEISLNGQKTENPATFMIRAVDNLVAVGAEMIVVACNTAHAPPIFDVFKQEVASKYPNVRLFHLVEETVLAIQTLYPNVVKVGILGTMGTYRFRLYDDLLEAHNFIPLRPEHPEILGKAIFDPVCGIKSVSAPVSEEAKRWVTEAINNVIEQGAEAVILGCTELPLAFDKSSHEGVPVIDPALIMARALVRTVAPDRLVPWRVA